MERLNLALYFIFALLLSCRPSVDEPVGMQGATQGLRAPQNIVVLTTNPSSNPTPRFLVEGNFQIGNTIALYLNSTCSGENMGSVVAQNNVSAYVTSLPLTEDGTYTYFSKTISRSGESSDCSESQATYSFQTGQTNLILDLASREGANLTPYVIVSNITVGASVFIFTDSSCTQLAGSESFVKSTVVEVRVNDNVLTNDGPYTFFARQVLGGSNGPCTGGIPPATYILNTKPQFMQTISSSPGMELRPTIRVGNSSDPNGALVPGAEVNLFSDPTCNPINNIGSKTAASNETTVVITIDRDLTADGTHKFYSTQKFNNHTSPCSLVFSQYDLDTNPTISIVSNSPGMDANPIFNVSGLLPGATALLYEGPGGGSTCMGTLVGEMYSDGTSVNVKTEKPLILSGAYQYSARQILPDSSTTNLAEYISPCSDVNPPDDTFIFNSPKVFFLTSSPNNINTPTIAVNELSPLATDVELYNGSSCSGPTQLDRPTFGNSYISFNIPLIPIDGSRFYSVKQIGGPNSGECMGSASFVLNTRPEGFEMVEPSLPIGNDATPTFKVANIVDYATTTVNLYNTSNCLGASVGSFTGPAISGEIQINVSTPIDAEGPREYFASQSIDGGIPSCSFQSIIYEYDLKPPVVDLDGPNSGNNPTPTIVVSGVLNDATTTIYTGDSGCETLRGIPSPPGNGTTRNITSYPLGDNDQGINIYWAKQEVNGVLSECSTAKATYNFSSSVGDILIVTENGALPVATGSNNTPLVEVRNVASGAFVEIFADNSCSVFMGSGISTNTVINITSSPLGLEGEHKYYAKQTINGVPGPCSFDFATYTLDTKPDAPILLTTSPNTILTPAVRVTNVIPGAQIKLFLDNNCADLVGEAQAITSQVDVTVNASNPLVVDGMYYFYVRQINAGHISPCSDSSSPVYVLDTRPQGMEILTAPSQSTPEDSWNDPTPLVRVSGIEPGANVILFKDMNCQEDIGSAISQQNFIDIEVINGALPNDGPYTFYSRQSYRGHTSWCSGTSNPIVSVSYKLDTSISLSVAGPNPNNLLSPEIIAQQTFSTALVELFSDSNCSVSISNVATSAGGDTPIFIVPPFAVDGDKAIFGNQVIDGYNSPCSKQLIYSLFSAPTIELNNATSPSPGNDNTPTFILSALMVEPSAGTTTVTIFDDINCSSAVSASEVITGATMQVTINPLTIVGEQTYYASQSSPTAGHTSTCSPTGAVYDFNLSPTVEMVTPSPNDILRPEVKVSNIVIGADVELFTDNNCIDLVGSATGATTTEVFITLDDDLLVDARYFFYARQTALGNTSPCSGTPAEYTLKTDDFLIAPQFPKSSDTTPNVIVSNIGIGDRITLYEDDMCLKVFSVETTSTGTEVSVTSDSLDTTQIEHVWYAVRKIGNQGFQSRCVGPSEPYELDIRPSTVTVASPSPGVDLQPVFQVDGVNSFATVTIYTDSDCTAGNETGSANTGVPNTVMVTTDPPLTSDGPFSVWARQFINGQLSDCSTDFGTYILDSSPLGPITTITFSPGDNPNPKIRVDGVVAGAQVDLHLDDTCSSAITGIGTVPTGNTSVEIDSFPLGQDGTYEYWAKQTLPTDPPYVSTCSATSTTYVLDTVPTNMFTLTTQPSAQNAPKILVEGVGHGDFVQLFTDAACTLPSGSNISSGQSVAIKVLPALADPNTYTFFSKRTQSGGLGITSKCSGEFGVSTDFIFNPSLSYKWEFSAEVKKDVQSINDEAGFAVTGSDNYLAMGTPGDGGGRIYFWKYNGFFWETDGNIVSSDIANGDRFGASLDLYTFNPNGQIANGDLLIVGAPRKGSDRGSAYIYTYNNGSWGSEQKINPSAIGNGDQFGSSVAIYNNLALIGAPNGNGNIGTVRSYESIGGTFNIETIINPPIGLAVGDGFGFSVSVYGGNVLISAPLNNRDTVFFYDRPTNSAPNYVRNLTPPPGTPIGSEFGLSLDLSSDYAIIGAPAQSSAEGRSYIYFNSDWSLINTLQAITPMTNARFGESVSITAKPDEQGIVIGNAVVGAPNDGTGQAYIFAGNNFVPVVDLPLFNNILGDRVGQSVFIFDDNILVGAPGVIATGMSPGDSAGAVYIYRNDL